MSFAKFKEMGRPLFISLFVVAFIQAHGQPIVWDKGSAATSIGMNTAVLADPDDSIGIGLVGTQVYANKFQPSLQTILHFGFTNSSFWLRFELENLSNDSLFLVLEQAFLPEASLYTLSNDKWERITSGYQIPLQRKPVIDHFQVFPLLNGRHTYYLHIKPYVHAIPIQVVEKNQWQVNATKQRIIMGIYIGILLFAVIINLFLFVTLRKTYFLSYSLLVFVYLLTSALVMEGYAVYLFPPTDLMFWYKIVPVLDMPAFLFYCISFFELKKNHNKLYKVSLLGIVFFCFYLISILYIPLLSVLLINQVFALSVFVLGIYVGIITGKAGNRLGYFFAIGYVVWFLLILIEAIYIQTGFPKHVSSLSYVSTAIFIEVFLLAFLQAKRFQWEKKEDHLKQFELRSQIDKMEQDFQREILNTKLEIQEQTFNIISQEIHDNIGQLLSLARIQANIMEQRGEKDDTTIFELKDTIGQAMNDLRGIAKNLSSQYILNYSLQETVTNQIQRINRLGLVSININTQGTEQRLANHKKIVLYRIIQESLQNIIKHAKASHVTIAFVYNETAFEVTVSDDGVGFDSRKAFENGQGLGLQNIVSRAELIGGKTVIQSESNYGTTIKITTPYG